MAYNKTTWANGDVITAEKLNNIEQGIADSNDVVYINYTDDNEKGEHRLSCDVDFSDIYSAFTNSKTIIVKYQNHLYQLYEATDQVVSFSRAEVGNNNNVPYLYIKNIVHYPNGYMSWGDFSNN